MPEGIRSFCARNPEHDLESSTAIVHDDLRLSGVAVPLERYRKPIVLPCVEFNEHVTQPRRESNDDSVAEHLFDVLDVRLNEPPPETRALVRSMLTAPEATSAMKDFLDERVDNLARAMDGGDAGLRAALAVSSILGLTIARHFLKLDALTEISDEQIETALRPWLITALGDNVTPPPPPDTGTSEQPPTT
jgi:hypothetical protein